ncbi:hypothetical protein LCGC14_0537120 [marine sediment metagenome]|uniref:Uncharacterized protein n=1 Tax=marine sediment metagenome TaxID=412755 RepID=A0A0F9SCF3_9ZZZZ
MKDLIIKHTAKVQANKLVMDNKELFQWDLENFEGKTIELVIKGIKNTRSILMNSYYWGVVIKALVDYFNSEQTFNRKVNADEVHELMKMKFLGTIVWNLPNGDEMESVETSKDLDNTEFIAYWENIIAWSVEMFNIKIPKPREKEMLIIDIEDANKHIG